MAYEIGDYKFRTEEFFTPEIMAKITEIRVHNPDVIYEEAEARRTRKSLTLDGKLTILAADHPARRVTTVGDDPLAMGDRLEYLGRILRVITGDEFDGVMGPPDIIEDLFIVSHLVKQGGGKGFLDNKVILGCMNRGGLAGTCWEMDDTFTAFTPEAIEELRLDGAKMMFRLDPENPASGRTITYCAWAVNELNELGIPAFIEPLPVKKVNGKYKTIKEAGPLIQTMGVASALGDSSAYVWLKIPYCEGYERVARATTLPCLMLGGAATGDPTDILREFAAGMKAGPSIRGALVGRNVLYPGADDPRATAAAIHRIVHEGISVDEAVEHIMTVRGVGMDDLKKWIH